MDHGSPAIGMFPLLTELTAKAFSFELLSVFFTRRFNLNLELTEATPNRDRLP